MYNIVLLNKILYLMCLLPISSQHGNNFTFQKTPSVSPLFLGGSSLCSNTYQNCKSIFVPIRPWYPDSLWDTLLWQFVLAFTNTEHTVSNILLMPVKCSSTQMLPTEQNYFRLSIETNFYPCKARIASVRTNNPA